MLVLIFSISAIPSCSLGSGFCFVRFVLLLYPSAQNQYMQEKILGELKFARIHAGLVFVLARIQENIFVEVFPEYCAKFLGEFTRCKYMPRLYSHPREYRKIFLANYLCIGFVPGGIVCFFSVLLLHYVLLVLASGFIAIIVLVSFALVACVSFRHYCYHLSLF